MDSYQENTYGERIANVYDQWYSEIDEKMIECLSELAHGGSALELGIGTGRVALPLQKKGIKMYGIDASKAMVEKMRAKPGGEQIPLTFGSFAEIPIEQEFELIYVVFNTFYGLLSQEDQVRCFQNAASHLKTDGLFVIEVFVPDLTRFHGRQALRVGSMGDDEIRLDATRHDPLNQFISSQHIVLSEQGVRLFPVQLRYAWPSELDLMARLAGLFLRDRWADWTRSAFTADSGKHISVYQLQKGS
jgi:SAM-dependent methyltransferase